MKISFCLLCIFATTFELLSQDEVDTLSIETLSFSELKKLAKGDHPVAQHELAKRYENMKSIKKRKLKKAIKYYTKSASRNYSPALYDLGRLYQEGIGFSKNDEIAVHYYTLSSQKDHTGALLRLAELFQEGENIKKNEIESIHLYLKAWRLGEITAIKKLDQLPIDTYPYKDNSEYIYYQAEKGSSKAQYQMGLIYQRGDEFFVPDSAKAFVFFKASADQEYPPSLYKIGQIYEQKQMLKKAIPYYLRSANKHYERADSILKKHDLYSLADTNHIDFLIYRSQYGEAPKQFILYEKYISGKDIPINYEKALWYCEQAALNNHRQAMVTLANIYEKGDSTDLNLEKAFYWYHKAASLDDAMAKYKIAEMYSLGKGVQKNAQKAVRWYLKSANSGIKEAHIKLLSYNIAQHVQEDNLDYVRYRANQGDIEAQFQLGKYLYTMQNSQAIDWLKKSADKGVTEAQLLLGSIYKNGQLYTLKDRKLAIEWYLKAANENLTALKELAFIYNTSSSKSEDDLIQAMYFGKKYVVLSQEDTFFDETVYFLLGNTTFRLKDYTQGAYYYNQFIRLFYQVTQKPSLILDAFYKAGQCYFFLEQNQKCIDNMEIAILQLEELKEFLSSSKIYQDYRANYLYLSAEALFREKQLSKACDNFYLAWRNGKEIDLYYLEFCQEE